MCCLGLWKDGLMCGILAYGKAGLGLWKMYGCVLSWSMERWVDVCHIGLWKDGWMGVILVYGKWIDVCYVGQWKWNYENHHVMTCMTG